MDGGKLWDIVWGELRWEGARRKRHEATTRWTEGKPWEIAWGELRWEGARTEATTGWTEGKAWEIAWGELRWKERDGSIETVDGRETVGNSLGRASLGRSETEATTGWTEGKPWEIVWGELRWEGARQKRRHGGRRENRGK